MAVHVSVATAIDKSKLASNVVYTSLFEMDVLDRVSGAVIETVRLAENNENFTYKGNTYVAMPFEFDIARSKNELPTLSISFYDMTQTLHGKLEETRGATDFPVRLLIISSVNPAQAEIEEHFTVSSAESDSENYSIKLTLGSENPLTQRFPARLMFRNRCPWKYRGVECRYSGPLASCDYTLNGANGCDVHNNSVNFGGFPGIRRQSYR